MIQLEGSLFEAVQYPGVFKDSKTFVDAIPKCDQEIIKEAYEKESKNPNFRLEPFLREYFIFPHTVTSPAARVDTSSVESYINSLWSALERLPGNENVDDTLIPLAYPYIVPGGRFREIYYWDSFFTSEGLAVIDRSDIIEYMVKNFIHLIDIIGFVPNGNRRYFMTRSQPPVLGYMIDLLYQKHGLDYIKDMVMALEREYQFWMDGYNKVSADNPAHRHLVLMPNGEMLNRYWDDLSIPRQESYREDYGLVKELGLDSDKAALLCRNLRAAAESGWDFTCRWFKDPQNIATIQTTAIIPVDLNALLFGVENLLVKYFTELGSPEKASFYQQAADSRQQAINNYFWNEKEGFYFDYNIETQQHSPVYSMAASVPLFVKQSNRIQSEAVKKVLEDKFLKPGGFVSTLIETGQQWDSPNGWAPLQWFAVKGLLNYGYDDLAREAMQRWIKAVRIHFDQSKMLMEKYNVCDPKVVARGGEYGVQEGFGWTNGIILKFLDLLSK